MNAFTKAGIVYLCQRPQPGCEICWAMARQLTRLRLVLPRIKEEQLAAANPDGFLDRTRRRPASDTVPARGRGVAMCSGPQNALNESGASSSALPWFSMARRELCFSASSSNGFRLSRNVRILACEFLSACTVPALPWMATPSTHAAPAARRTWNNRPRKPGERTELQVRFGQQCLSGRSGPETLYCVIEVRAVVIGAPNIHRLETQRRNAGARFFDRSGP